MLEDSHKAQLNQEQIMKQIKHKDLIQKNQQCLKFIIYILYVNKFQIPLLLNLI